VCPFFIEKLCWITVSYRKDLHELLAPAVAAAGFELYGVEYIAQGRHSLLRVYIDHPEGIDVEDCALASQQISAVLDVEDPINNEYDLEVSSPGVERPLFIQAHYQQAQGREVQLNLQIPVSGQRKFRGVIKDVTQDTLSLESDNVSIELSLANIAKAHLIINFDEKGTKHGK
jgi:ribosome maturation factor RimP